MERDLFLNRVGAALRGAHLPDVSGASHAPAIRFSDPVARFVDQAEAVAANVFPVAGTREVFDLVERVLGGRPFIAWDDLDHIVSGWQPEAARRGWNRVDATVMGDSRESDHKRVASAAVGITGADCAIAATGTVVLAHGPGRPRSASLLVEDHIVLLPADRIVHSLEEALRFVDWSQTSNLVAITGPSRTGDIESILTLGVHGPRHVHIVLIG